MKRTTLVFVMLALQAVVFSQGNSPEAHRFETPIDFSIIQSNNVNQSILNLELKNITKSKFSMRIDTIIMKVGYGTYKHILNYDQSGNLETQHITKLENENWTNVNFISFTYDETGNVLSKLIQKDEGTNWVNSQLFANTYNENSQVLTEIIQEWVNDSWVNGQHNIYTYNENGELLTFQNQSWGPDGTLFHKYLSSYSYSGDLLQFDIFQEWIDNAWQNSWKNIYTYDNNNNISSHTEQMWNETEWGNLSQIFWSYDNEGNILNYITQHWFNESWMYSSKRIYTYDDFGNTIVDLELDWSAEGWKNHYQKISTYDEEGNQLTYLSQLWLIDTWNNRFINTYTYDNENHLLTYQKQEWEDTILINKYLYTDVYDADGNRVSHLHQNWHNETWYNHAKVEYEFLPNRIVATEYDWNATYWKEHWLSTYIDIIKNGESVFSRTAIKIELFYSELTDIEDNYFNDNNYKIQIYPNPAKDYIIISTSKESVYEVLFYNQSGQLIQTVNSPSKTIDISNLKPGLYFAEIKTSEGDVNEENCGSIA